jgi:type IV pilus assembly protein PilC
MSSYHYRAVDDAGRLVKGTVSAASETDIERELSRRGLLLIQSSVQRESIGSRWLGRRRIPAKLLIEFYHRFAQTLEIGLPILSSLEEIGRSFPSPLFKRVIGDIQFSVAAGNSLREAMGNYPWVFAPLDLAMVEMGEKTGVLPKCLKDLAAHHEWKADIRSVLKKAALYPAFILCAIGAVIGVWIGYVLPQMAAVLAELGIALPWVTMAILDASRFLRDDGAVLLAGFLSAAAVFCLYQKTESGQLAVHRRLLNLPLFGSIARNICLTRLCHNFATMFSAGMTIGYIFQALCNRALGNRYLENRLAAAHQEIERGESIARAFEKAEGFPPLLLGALYNGETTGTIDESLKRMGEYYDREVKRTVQVLVSAIEPAAIFSLGGIFGIIVLSILLPLYDVMGQLGKAY